MESEGTDFPSKADGRRGLSARARRVVLVLLIAYICWCVLLFLIQEFLLFPASWMRQTADRFPMDGAELIERVTDQGERIEAFFLPAPGADADHPRPVVAYFHGNAEIVDGQHAIVAGYHRLGLSVLLCEYRGFGRSDGTPSRETIRSDAEFFYDTISARPDVDKRRIVFHGYSLGGAVAADLAANRKPATLILQSTFTSMSAIAHRFLVPAFIARNRYDTAGVVATIDIPVLVLHGTHDGVIPVSHGRNLGKTGSNTSYTEWACDHGNMAKGSLANDYWNRIRSFLETAALLSQQPK